jgi:uncharacterized protein
MFVGALRLELFFPNCHSLKEKRAHIRPVVEGLRNRFQVAAAEVEFQDLWQRCAIGVSAVGSTASHVESVLQECERFVWSFPEHEVTSAEWQWLEE